jgi:hypothetical protein
MTCNDLTLAIKVSIIDDICEKTNGTININPDKNTITTIKYESAIANHLDNPRAEKNKTIDSRATDIIYAASIR